MGEANRLFIADPDDVNYPEAPTTSVIEFADADCDPETPGFAFIDAPHFGADPFDSVSLAAYGHDGDAQAGHRRGDRDLSFSLIYKEKPIEEIIADLQIFSTAVESHGVLGWQMKGTDDLLYFDFKPSPIPHLLRGQRGGVYRLVTAMLEADGIPIRLICHPWPRSAPVDASGGAIAVHNESGSRTIFLSNPGNKPSEIKISLDVETGNYAGVRASIRSQGDLTEYAAIHAQATSGADFTDTYDTAVAAVSDAEGGSCAVTDFATVPTMEKRLRVPIPMTDPTALQGVHLCFARLVPINGATRGRYNVQLRYGFTSDPYAMQIRPKVELDFRDVNPQNFVEVFLGLVVVPRASGAVYLDLYEEQLSGDYDLAVDQLILDPADWWHSYCTVPGHRLGSWSRSLFEAEELAGDGTLKRDTYRINTTGDVARIEPVAGIPLAAGIHAFELEATIREPDDDSITDGDNPTEKTIGTFEIFEVTGSTIERTVNLRNKKNRRWTKVDRTIYFEVSAADVTAGKRYRARVVFSAATLSGRRIQVHNFKHRFVRAITPTSPFEIDSNLWLESRDRGSRAVDGAGARLFPMVLENDPPLAPPGDSVLVISGIQMPVDPGYGDLDEREPLGRSILDPETNVSVTVTPRWSHP